MEHDVIQAIQSEVAKLPKSLNQKSPEKVKKEWARKLINTIPVASGRQKEVNAAIAIATFLSPKQVAGMRMAEEGVVTPPTKPRTQGAGKGGNGGAREGEKGEERTLERGPGTGENGHAGDAAQIKSEIMGELAGRFSEFEKKITATLDKALTRQPGEGNGRPKVTVGGIELEVPGNPVTVAVAPDTQMYYSLLRKINAEHGEETGSFSEFLNICVEEWFERRGYRFGLFRSNVQPIQLRGPGT